MIVLKTNAELEKMRVASRITAEAIELAGEYVKPGVSTLELDTIAEKYIRSQGAEPNFLHLYDFPNTACISVNEEIIHGIPKKDRILIPVGSFFVRMRQLLSKRKTFCRSFTNKGEKTRE